VTYCVAIHVDEGLVFAADSRTNAGIDHVSSYPKLHTFHFPGERLFVLLSAGNLATTQKVIKKLGAEDAPNLSTVATLHQAADLVGHFSTEVQQRQQARDTANTSFEATFILGGQIAGQPPELFLIYPQGNFIHEPPSRPFLQIGEIKYGKPILDRVIRPDTRLETAARCALVSINSTIRSNVTVGAPIDVFILPRDNVDGGYRLHLTEEDPYYRELAERWNAGLLQVMENLPRFPWEHN
jgi:putative proteasome-type protease